MFSRYSRFINDLEGTFLRHNHILVKCRSHAILSFSVASVFLINLLALPIQVLVECFQNILGS